jgi:transcriptional regulator with XRE-family HTH domain
MFRKLMGQKIAARRKAQRWSQEGLAEQAGWSRQQLSRVELGTSSIAADRLLALADVLECEVADLVPTREEVQRRLASEK